jgi:hypothetical protein
MQKIRPLVEARTNKSYYRFDWKVGCSVSQTNSIWCHGNSLSPILVIGRCKQDFSKTFGGVEKVLWQSKCMWSCNRWQITMNGPYHSFRVGFGCSTRIVQVNDEV